VQETIAALHQVIVLDPRDVESYSLLGEALASVGEYAQAERVYRRLVRLTPDDPIEIAGLDLQPCGGTHVRATGEIGAVRVTQIEKKGKQNRRVRLALA